MPDSSQLNLFGYIALFGYIPVVLGLFAFFRPRQACIWGFLIAWLFLPMDHIALHGFTDYNKASAAGVGILLGALIFDSETLFAFRPKLWDLPMLIWCVCPFISSVENGLGAYDGLTAAVYQTTFWGLPYFIGRVYFSDLAGLRELAIGIVIGGLIYAPLCWYEIRFSPQLHRIVYGHHQYEFGQSIRYNSYRPMVFMQHGLAVGMWMTSATVTAFWLYWSKTATRIFGLAMGVIFLVMVVTTVLCHSVGAAVIMFVGIAALAMTRWIRLPVWVIVLALAPSAYMYLRGSDLWTGKSLVNQIAETDPRGGSSLRVRIESERFMVNHAMKRPIFGWAGWDRARGHDEEGDDAAIPDALWIYALGHYGLVGLISFTAVLTLPLLLLVRRIPVEYWQHPGAAPAAALAMLPTLYMCDNLMNGMINPIFILCAAGVMGMTFTLRKAGQEDSTLPGQRPIAPFAQSGARPLPNGRDALAI